MSDAQTTIHESPFNNLFDYMNWRGDLPISADYPLNELDHAIFARLSYMPYNAVGYGKIEKISSLCKEIGKLPIRKFLLSDDKKFAQTIIDRNRYNKLVISDIIINNDPQSEKQFGAITILLPNNTLYISYLGTDDTLYGWKEDFNMTFLDNIPSQLDGLRYLEHIASKYPEHKIYLGGHSKGGNIAMYANLVASPEIQKRLISVDNFDGPGFDYKRAGIKVTKTALQRINTYFPQESLIGRLMDHEEESVFVIESVETGLMQHDIFSWQVNPTSFVRIKNAPKQVNYVFNKSIRKWLDECSLEQRKLFIDTIYESLLAADYNLMSDLRRNPIHAVPAVAKAYKSNTTPAERKEIKAIAKMFVKNYLDVRKRNNKEHQRANAAAHRVNKTAQKTRHRAAARNGEQIDKAFF